jgi:tRNA nucleotidyltransferase/poly(A) polymerase
MERQSLQIALPESLDELAAAFSSRGSSLYVVGGAVRDAVLGLVPKDLDLATDAAPHDVKAIVSSLGHPVMEVGAAFGVIATELPGATEHVEIATFREDLSLGRHPTVRFATIVEDVQRRDLTCNALFYDIRTREVVDLVGGLSDIRAGILRAVGDPQERFREDKLRVLRAIRFAARFGWQVDPATSRALLSHDLDGISSERIHDELIRTLATAQSPELFCDLMTDHNLWARVIPGLWTNPPVMSRSVPVFLAGLLSTNDPVKVDRILRSMKYSDREVRSTMALLELSRFDGSEPSRLRKRIRSSGLTDSEVLEYVIGCGISLDPNIMALGEYMDMDPVRGDPLLALGFSGKELGMELERRELELFQGLVGA